MVSPERRRPDAPRQADPPHIVLDPALAPAALARTQPDDRGNAGRATGGVLAKIGGRDGDRDERPTGSVNLLTLEGRQRREVVEREIAARIESDLVEQFPVIPSGPPGSANRLAQPGQHPLAPLLQGPSRGLLTEAQPLARRQRRRSQGRPREPVGPAQRLQETHRDQVVSRRAHGWAPSSGCAGGAAPSSPSAIARAAIARPAR